MECVLSIILTSAGLRAPSYGVTGERRGGDTLSHLARDADDSVLKASIVKL